MRVRISQATDRVSADVHSLRMTCLAVRPLRSTSKFLLVACWMPTTTVITGSLSGVDVVWKVPALIS
jgi:hypothetical protein